MCPQVTFDEVTHTYFMDGKKLPSVTEVMPHRTGYDFVDHDRMEQTRADGKWLHHIVDQHMKRKDGEEVQSVAGIEIALEKFIADHPEFGAFVGSEVILWSMFRYAGTADMLFEHAVVDVKRTIGPRKYHSLQTAGYHRAAVERRKIHQNRNHWVVMLKDNGTYKAVNVWNELAEVMFLSLVKAYHAPEYRENVDRVVDQYLNS